MTPQLIQFRAPGTLEKQLHNRTPTGKPGGEIARRDLTRYYTLLRQNLPTFSLNEAMLIVEALKNTHVELETIGHLWTTIQQAIQTQHLDTTWQVDGKALVERCQRFTASECMAVYDAVEQVTCHPTPIIQELKERIVQVGLARQK